MCHGIVLNNTSNELMKNRIIRSPSPLAFMLWFAISLHAPAQAVRVAVAGDSSLANLIDATTAELSKRPDINLLERTDLEKIGQEKEIQSVLEAKDFSPVRLLPADGLVLLRAVTMDGKTSVFSRLVAVQPGVILREVALPDNADPLIQAQALAREFAPYWSKLAAIRKGKIETLSLLGLRFDVDSPRTRDTERSINMLLASRLSAEPNTLVLERWRLNDAVFEKSLVPQQPAPFWTGSSLIDGSVKGQNDMKGENDLLEVTMRVRSPQGTEISVSDRDTAGNLPALVERMVVRIRGHPAVQDVWKPLDEAAHYAQLGNWCLDNRLYEEGEEAYASALALGDNTRTTHMLQVKACTMQAYPDDFRYQSHVGLDYNSRLILADSIPGRVSAAIEASRLARDYMNVNQDFSSPAWTLEDPQDLGLCVLGTCLRVLWMAYDNGFQSDHAEAVAGLRHETQQLMDEIGAKLASRSDSKLRDAFLNLRVFQAGLWHEKPEETIAFYREALTGGRGNSTQVRRILFGSLNALTVEGLREPDLDGDINPIHFFAKNGPPWIYAWDGRSPDEVKALWKNFIDELAASPDPILQCDALKFKFYSMRTITGRDEVLAHYIAFLQQHRDLISGPRGDDMAAGLGEICFWAAGRAEIDPESKPKVNAFADLNLDLLKRHVVLPLSWFTGIERILDAHPATIDVPSLLAAVTDYCQWYQTQTPHDDHVIQFLTHFRQWAIHYIPGASPVESISDALSVNRFWDSFRLNPKTGQPAQVLEICEGTLQAQENHVWFLTFNAPHAVLEVDPADGQIVSSHPIPAELDPKDDFSSYGGIHHYLEVTPQWLVVGLTGQALLGSRQSQAATTPAGDHWQALSVPPSSYKPRWANGQLYLLYNAQFGDKLTTSTAREATTAGSGLIRVSVANGTCETLISSRRVPPQNSLDGHPLGVPLDLWQSPAGLHLAITDRPIYTSPTGKNDWFPETVPSSVSHLKLTPGGPLVEERMTGRFASLTLLHDGGGKVLLSNTDGAQFPVEKQPAWNLPQELKAVLPREIVHTSPFLRGDDLCLYYNSEYGASAVMHSFLFYFAKGQKNALKIPLVFDYHQFKFQGSERSYVPILGYEELQATDYGLVIAHGGTGFWTIPWSDIDAYRAKYNPATAPAAATKAAE